MNKIKILEKLKNNVATAILTTKDLSDEKFFAPFNEKWSIAENLVHLAKSAKGFNKALEMPKAVLENFGKPEKPSRSYEEVEAQYHEVLSKIVFATNPFSPQIADNQRVMGEVVERFEQQHTALANHLSALSEEELDAYVVPHPALGKLTLREMFCFMAFHIKHHQAAINRILSHN
jgi:DinB superfamily